MPNSRARRELLDLSRLSPKILACLQSLKDTIENRSRP